MRSLTPRARLVLVGVALCALAGAACSSGLAAPDLGTDTVFFGNDALVHEDGGESRDGRPRVDVGFTPSHDREMPDGADEDASSGQDAGDPDSPWGHLDAGAPDRAMADARPPDMGPVTCQADPGEPNDSCPGDQLTIDEGETQTVIDRRISMNADKDTFSLHFAEGSHFCLPGSGQSYSALVELVPPAGVDLRLGYNTDSCNNSFSPLDGGGLCLSWSGTCASGDDIDLFVQVTRVSGQSCEPYTLRIQFCDEGQTCPGC